MRSTASVTLVAGSGWLSGPNVGAVSDDFFDINGIATSAVTEVHLDEYSREAYYFADFTL